MSDEDTLHPEAEQPQRPEDGTTQSLHAPGAPGSESATQQPEAATTQSLQPPGAPSSEPAGTPSLLLGPRDGAPLPSPTRPVIPGYEILEELGRGAMAVVYKARHIGLNRIVALKVILAAEHAGREAVARFRAGAEAVAQLKHPNIVQVYDIGEQDGRPCFSMEFAESGSLAKRLASGSSLTQRGTTMEIYLCLLCLVLSFGMRNALGGQLTLPEPKITYLDNGEVRIAMDLALGGDSGGDPSRTEFSARYEVDYLRLHRKQ